MSLMSFVLSLRFFALNHCKGLANINSMSSKKIPLNSKEVLQLLQPEGLLSRILKGFEPRIQQQKMLNNVVDAYNHSSIALIEAGTGTGKSLAYLIPAILWAALN